MRAHHVQEQPLHARVGRHLGMESCSEQGPLAHQCREAVALGEHLAPWPTRVMRGERMNTISSGPPGNSVGASRL